MLQDRYARTSIRNSTCDAVPQGSVLGPTRQLKLEPNHDVATLCELSLVGRHRSTRQRAPPTSPSDSSRIARPLFLRISVGLLPTCLFFKEGSEGEGRGNKKIQIQVKIKKKNLPT